MGGDKPPPQTVPVKSAGLLGAVQAGGGAEPQPAAPLVQAGGCKKTNAGPAEDKREAPPTKDAELEAARGGEEVGKEGPFAPSQPPPPPKNWNRGKAGRPLQKGGGEPPPSSGGAGKGRALASGGGGGGYWKEGCLQSELIQFHLKKGLAAAQMQSPGDASEAEPQSASSSAPSPMAPAGGEEGNGRSGAPEGASSLNPQQQLELQEELEKLREENESLKVRKRREAER